MISKNNFRYYSAPGRVCLFGEHQDYLKLKVVPAAINLRTKIGIKTNKTTKIKIHSFDISISDEIDCLQSIELQKNELDYFRAIIKILADKDIISHLPGMDVNVKSEVPIGSGLSSSAALLVAWLTALNNELDLNLDRREIAQLCFEAENKILKINCGIMDQYSSSLGGIFSLDCDGPPYNIVEFPLVFESIVIGDSLVRRSANEPLTILKEQLNSGIKKLTNTIDFNLKAISLEELDRNKFVLTENEFSKLKAVLIIRDATIEAENELLKKEGHNHHYLGKLLTIQQEMLRDNLQVSIPKLDLLISASLSAGALGAKLTGAGLGGCMIAYAPGKEDQVAQAINSVGGRAFICKIDSEGGREEK